MKIGYRKPSIKKSFKSKTTGSLKRTVKRGINPVYGKKGTGLLKNPKKAIYNKVYNATSVDPLSGIKKEHKNSYKYSDNSITYDDLNIKENSQKEEIHKTRKEIIETRKNANKENNTKYLDINAVCCRCNKDLGLFTFRSRIQLVDGWLCMKCAKKIFKLNEMQRKAYSVSEINEIFKEKLK